MLQISFILNGTRIGRFNCDTVEIVGRSVQLILDRVACFTMLCDSAKLENEYTGSMKYCKILKAENK